MANYYIDCVNGDDGYDGTVPDYTSGTTGPKLTIASMNSTVSDGAHTIWLSPGTHLSANATITLTQSGTNAGAKLYWKGDPNKANAWDATISPGIVNVTRSTSGVPTVGTLIDFASETNVEWWDIFFDGVAGTTSSTNMIAGSRNSGVKLLRCVVVGGGRALYAVAATQCVIFGGNAGVANCYGANGVITDSFIMGRTYGASDSDLDQCISFCGPGSAFTDSTATGDNTVKNSFLMSGVAAMRNEGTAANAKSGSDNNIVFESYYMCRGFGTAKLPAGNLLVHCYADTYSNETAGFDASSSRHIYNENTYAATPPVDAHCFTLPPALTILRALGTIFKPLVFNDAAMADAAPTSLTIDIDGLARTTRFNSETETRAYQGPWSMNDVVLSYDGTKKNVIKIRKLGQVCLNVPLKANTATTISINCVCDLGGGATYPLITLSAPNGTPNVATDSATGTTEETLVVSTDTNDIPYDCVGKLILSNVETGAGSYVDFYNLVVS